MNIPNTIELAIRETVAQFAPDAVPVAWIHCATTPADLINPRGVVQYPQMRIACGGKLQAQDASVWDAPITIYCASLAEEDTDGAQMNGIYGAVEAVFDHLLFGDAADEVVQCFTEAVRRDYPAFILGGFSPMGGEGAQVLDGVYSFIFGGTLHFSL